MLELFPYQKTGVEWLSKMNWALLADDMGLGKSCQVVLAAKKIAAKNILVICPASARVNWQREFAMWDKERGEFTVCLEGADNPTTLTICSYNYADHHLKKIKRIDWDLVVVDEAHFVKSKGADRTKAIFGVQGIVRKTKRMWLVSGTPLPNNNSELWVMLYTFGVTKLPYEDYIQKYCKTYRYQGRKVVTGNKRDMDEEVREMLSRIMLRRLKEDVMTELPPIMFSDVAVEAGEVDLGEHSSFFEYVFPYERKKDLQQILMADQQLLDANISRLKLSDNGMHVLEGIAKSISTLRRYNGLQKVEPIAAMVKNELELKRYSKIVIFAIHRDVIEGLRKRLHGHGAVTLYGNTDPDRRQRNIDKFQNDPACKVFIGNIQAAGTAITLTSAHQVLFVEQEWTPGHNAQAAMRCHRLGQKNTVYVRFVGIDNSIDQHIASVLRRKTRELTAILDDKDGFKPVKNPQGEV